MRFLPALIVAGMVSWGARAQEPAPQDLSVPTLRVFANLIQIPTVVLDDRGRPVEAKTKPRFMVRLDGGKPFAPAHVRLEGEDPISLGLMLDASGGEDELLQDMARELPMLVPDGLNPRDHVTIYAADCITVSTLVDAPADRISLKVGVEQALRGTGLHGKNHGSACAKTLALRDTLFVLARQLGQTPGRRVILAITEGVDGRSSRSWAAVQTEMKVFGVAVFGIALTTPHPMTQVKADFTEAPQYDEAFNTMCQTSGGLVLTTTERSLKDKLAEWMKIVRGRYIVQFPRPDMLGSGTHLMEITVPGKDYFVRAAGASIPIADPKLKDDPMVLRGPVGEGGPGS